MRRRKKEVSLFKRWFLLVLSVPCALLFFFLLCFSICTLVRYFLEIAVSFYSPCSWLWWWWCWWRWHMNIKSNNNLPTYIPIFLVVWKRKCGHGHGEQAKRKEREKKRKSEGRSFAASAAEEKGASSSSSSWQKMWIIHSKKEHGTQTHKTRL